MPDDEENQIESDYREELRGNARFFAGLSAGSVVGAVGLQQNAMQGGIVGTPIHFMQVAVVMAFLAALSGGLHLVRRERWLLHAWISAGLHKMLREVSGRPDAELALGREIRKYTRRLPQVSKHWMIISLIATGLLEVLAVVWH